MIAPRLQKQALGPLVRQQLWEDVPEDQDQDYQNGFYSAYHSMAQEDLDCVVHVGDCIYEGAADPTAPRQVRGGETVTLDDYRNRYAIYRLDPSLQEVHARFPFIATWDDHEVENNYAGAISEDGASGEAFLARRAAAYRAYFEHMPIHVAPPKGADMQIYRALQFGDLAAFNVLDTRPFRSDQPCGDGLTFCPEVFNASATVLGQEQMRWLERQLTRSRARWNVLAQQIMMTLHRGYLVCEVTPQLWTTQYRAVSTITTPEAAVSTLATFVTEAGRPGAQLG